MTSEFLSSLYPSDSLWLASPQCRPAGANLLYLLVLLT